MIQKMHHADYDYDNNYMEQNASYQADGRSVNQEILLFFMEPVGWLPCSQEPATKYYSEPYECSPHPHIPFPRQLFPYYPPIYNQISQMASWPYGFWLKFCVHCSAFLFINIPLPSHRLWFDNSNIRKIWRRLQIVRFLIMQFSQPSVTLSLLAPNIILRNLLSNILSLSSSLGLETKFHNLANT